MNSNTNRDTLSIPVPECIRACKVLHGQNQRKALVYVAQRMQWKEDYTFSPVELAGVLGITRYGAHKLLMAMAKLGLVQDLGNVKFDIPAEQQRSHSNGWKVYGFTHFFIHQYQANVSAVKALFGDALPQKSCSTITYPHNREYTRSQVERVLDRFLDRKGLRRIWSEKRGGWIIECPGKCEHTDRKGPDETILFTTPKHNKFLLISAKCRHESCGDALMAWCKALNKEWGKYFYECQYGTPSIKRHSKTYTPAPSSKPLQPEKSLDCHRSLQNQPVRVESKPATPRCFIHIRFLGAGNGLFQVLRDSPSKRALGRAWDWVSS